MRNVRRAREIRSPAANVIVVLRVFVVNTSAPRFNLVGKGGLMVGACCMHYVNSASEAKLKDTRRWAQEKQWGMYEKWK